MYFLCNTLYMEIKELRLAIFALYLTGDTQQQVDQFSMPLQPNQLQVENLNLQSNTLLPISNFNPTLPTEPLPYEEALTIQRCVMETTSPNAKVPK